MSEKSWKRGEDYVVYDRKADGSVAQCNHCHKTFTNERSVAYQHKKFCSAFKTQGEQQKSIMDYIDNKIGGSYTKLQKIVRYICTSATSINATTDQTFIDLIQEGFSYETIRKAIIDYAEDVKQKTKEKIADATVALVMDGATIIHSGWYCIGVATSKSIYFYGSYHLSETTTRAISHQVNEVIEEIKKETRACVVGVCTDNASNISNVFDPACPDSINKLFGKHLLRVPCQAHTANLVLASYERLSPSFARLRSRIRGYARTLRDQNKQELFGIKCRCPPIREQRWFTDFDALQWIVMFSGKLRNAHKNMPNIIGSKSCPITKSWIELYFALRPLATFTWSIEADVLPISSAYQKFENMKKELARLESEGNKHAKNMLKIVQSRWSSTADENLLKLTFFTQNSNLMNWRVKYDRASLKASNRNKTKEDIDEYTRLGNEANLMIETTKKYCKFMGYDFTGAEEEIKFTLHHASPPHSKNGDDFWVSLSVSGPNTNKQSIALNKKELNIEHLSQIAEFYYSLSCLPASEAYCERVFKNMRELFDIYRMSASDDLIAAQTLVRMSIRMERRERNEIDDVFEDVFEDCEPSELEDAEEEDQ